MHSSYITVLLQIAPLKKTISEIYTRYLESCPDYTNTYNPSYDIFVVLHVPSYFYILIHLINVIM
jgi:hypothetical protein